MKEECKAWMVINNDVQEYIAAKVTEIQICQEIQNKDDQEDKINFFEKLLKNLKIRNTLQFFQNIQAQRIFKNNTNMTISISNDIYCHDDAFDSYSFPKTLARDK